MKRPCTTDLLLLEICMGVFFERSSNFKHKNLEKKVIVKLQAVKRNYLHVIFKDFTKSFSNFDHDFFLKHSFRKPKMLLAANANLSEYINKEVYQKFMAPGPLCPLTFLYRMKIILE